MAVDVKLGINLGFAVNKYVEPHVWARIVAEELGLTYVQFVADLLNAFLPEAVLQRQLAEIQEQTAKHGLQITSTFTSSFTRVNHFMHPDEETRRVWLDWFKRFVDLSAAMGASSTGSHFGILTFADYGDPARRDYLVGEALKQWRELSWYAKDKGMAYLTFEPMSVPREMANTVEETKELLERLNDGAGIPFKLVLDVGHAPHPSDRDPYRWVRELGGVSPIIHIQQTEQDHSRHWPFTPEYNALGIIHGEPLLAALETSGAKEAELVFELSHREAWSTEFRIIEDHKASVAYWRQFVSK
ncbi:sugar phosphate isomerase/epimerase [Paenibacillus sp. MWE-103]|uniref:Sugar phosphate isomerase/epimerase n=1 Tax=Paenibacillus artemisiicola TaxID=1172618 RepID=A0ABS3WDM6_9BACL|nr:sugar phosphate isomerase/epimerase [Paenibacillus artemisiicola]MBO7746461.1 sugar phosphate isomerase/epimerase [Paenibacillus artemisiicola]